eukprot:Gb_04996 [translate_table: standard]
MGRQVKLLFLHLSLFRFSGKNPLDAYTFLLEEDTIQFDAYAKVILQWLITLCFCTWPFKPWLNSSLSLVNIWLLHEKKMEVNSKACAILSPIVTIFDGIVDRRWQYQKKKRRQGIVKQSVSSAEEERGWMSGLGIIFLRKTEDGSKFIHPLHEEPTELKFADKSFQGLTCLMQISTRSEDFVVDTLILHNHIGPYLGHIFADPVIKKRKSSFKKSVGIINPTTRKPQYKVQACTQEKVNKIMETSKVAQKAWAKTPLWKRAEILHRVVALLKEHKAPIV